MVADKNSISNLLDQVETTTISVGSLKGHFISTKQLHALRLANDEKLLTREDTPSSVGTEEELLSERLEVAEAIRQKHQQILNALPSERSDINLDLGQLLSRRARLDKAISKLSI